MMWLHNQKQWPPPEDLEPRAVVVMCLPQTHCKEAAEESAVPEQRRGQQHPWTAPPPSPDHLQEPLISYATCLKLSTRSFSVKDTFFTPRKFFNHWPISALFSQCHLRCRLVQYSVNAIYIYLYAFPWFCSQNLAKYLLPNSLETIPYIYFWPWKAFCWQWNLCFSIFLQISTS